MHPTDLRAFKSRYLLTGEQAIAERGHQNTELAGMLDVAGDRGWQVEHVLSACAGPSGRVTRVAFDTIVGPLIVAAEKGEYDGVLLMLHGAMVTEFCEDGEGEILNRIRAVIGSKLPIAVTLDPHANVTQNMCDQANILVSFTSYPHVDMRTTGRRAAELLHQTMQGEITPRTLCVRRPMLEEVNGGRTDIGPMIERHTKARAYETCRKIFAVSINGGFASSDILEVGPTVLVTYQGEDERPLKIANELADDMWNLRHEVLNDYMSVQDAADIAAGWDISDGPLVIADYADNPGAGAYGDSTALLESLLAANITDACFGPLVDAKAVKVLSKLSVGEQVQIAIGGNSVPNFGGGPVTVDGKIMWQGDGLLIGDGPILGGLERDYGPTVVLRVGGMDILIVTIADQMRDLQQFRTFGIDPAKMRVVALKSMQHFRAAFEPIAGKTIVCDSGALCTTQYNLLPYKNAPRPIFPLDEI